MAAVVADQDAGDPEQADARQAMLPHDPDRDPDRDEQRQDHGPVVPGPAAGKPEPVVAEQHDGRRRSARRDADDRAPHRRGHTERRQRRRQGHADASSSVTVGSPGRGGRRTSRQVH